METSAEMRENLWTSEVKSSGIYGQIYGQKKLLAGKLAEISNYFRTFAVRTGVHLDGNVRISSKIYANLRRSQMISDNLRISEGFRCS
jgi:hypothetical protein